MIGLTFDEALEAAVAEFGQEVLAELSSAAFSRQFAERLVHGFIRANAPKNRERNTNQQRAARALKALFDARAAQRADAVDDAELLMRMATLYWLDRHGPERSKRPRAIRALALAASKSGKNQSTDAAIHRLSEKFRSNQSEWMSKVNARALTLDGLHMAALDELEALLTKLGLRFHAYA